MKNWPRLKMAEIAPIIRREVMVSTEEEYPELGIRSFGKGTFHKPALKGSDAGSKRLFEIHAGDLIFSNVFAWEGAIAIATKDDHGRFGSHRFISCQVDQSQARAEYIKYYLTCSQEGIAQIQAASPGGAGRNRTLGLGKLGEITIPLPPLQEQCSILDKIERLQDKTRQLNEHLAAIEADSQKLLLSLHHRAASEQKTKVGDFLELREDQVPIRQEAEYIQVGVRSFGAGLFEKSALKGIDTSYRTFNRLYTDALVLSQVKGWEGALALCPESLKGKYVSPEYRTFQCIPGRAHPSYIGELVNTPWFWSLLQAATRGVGARRERTRPEQFLSIELPMPSFSAQVEISKILWRQKQMRAHFTELRAANDALIPATLERVFLR